MAPVDQEAWEIYFSGHVQGVGFRFTTRAIAAQFAVTGFVENLSDGRVHVVAEGNPDELTRFVAAIESDLAGYIHSRQIHRKTASGQYSSFEIRLAGG